jgi:Rieske Fe-S protein
MSISRRHFLVAGCACAAAGAVGCTPNPARSFEASVDRSLPLPSELARAGGQAKVKLPGENTMVLVWRTDIGFGAVALVCPHCMGEIRFDATEKVLLCPMGSKFALDGSLKQGPAKKPLRAFVADLDGERLRILG